MATGDIKVANCRMPDCDKAFEFVSKPGMPPAYCPSCIEAYGPYPARRAYDIRRGVNVRGTVINAVCKMPDCRKAFNYKVDGKNVGRAYCDKCVSNYSDPASRASRIRSGQQVSTHGQRGRYDDGSICNCPRDYLTVELEGSGVCINPHH